jgi:hypothetical protein
MSAPSKTTIIAQGVGARYEYDCVGTVTPGDIVERVGNNVQRSTGVDEKIGNGIIIAVEATVFGRGINPGSGYVGINGVVDYESGDRVICEICGPGMSLNCNVLPGAAVIENGTYITLAGGGKVKAGTKANAFGVAAEKIDNSTKITIGRFRVTLI